MGDYNTTVLCKSCGWANTYDKNDDWRHMGDIKRCPRCTAEVIRVSYKPIT
jgi:predicted Zn-ribbon and HTH transcriptional regulator